MRRNSTALDNIHRGTSASAHQAQRSDFGKGPSVVQQDDDQVYCGREERSKVYFNVSIPSTYNILTGQEKYNPEVGIKLDVIITGQEQYISTVGNNLVQVAAQQHLLLLRPFLSTNGGVTARTAAVVQRHEGKEPDDKRLAMDRGDVRRYPMGEVLHHHPSGAAVQGTSPYGRLCTSWRQ